MILIVLPFQAFMVMSLRQFSKCNDTFHVLPLSGSYNVFFYIIIDVNANDIKIKFLSLWFFIY